MYIAGWLRALILLGTQQFRMAQARYDPMICGTAKQPARTDPYALQAPWECWDYINRGYISWDVFYPSCGLNHQSPIDIYPQMVVPRPELPELQFRNFNQFVTEFRMTNLRAGTLVVELDSSYNLSLSLDESWTNSYQLKQIQFKWGNSDNEGSEHRIGSNAYPLEIQFIHVDESQKWRGGARPSDNYMAAVSVFAQTQSCHSNSKSFLSILGHLPREDESISDDAVFLIPKGFFPVDFLPRLSRQGRYFRYNGSLTHPPCTEAVNWIIFESPIDVSYCALEYLRSLKFKEGNLAVTPSFRMLQPVNDRTVLYRDEIGPNLPKMAESKSCSCRGSYDDLVYSNLGTHGRISNSVGLFASLLLLSAMTTA